ncbi:carbon-nitrogen hydrolase family protein [Opitutus sp. ER46]|uniref:carbon-nitrogen hydrolase family protein n=1 Tax=Opitutus sp. ER46 TaxID=2161864 RepID=UPI000D30EFFE|nr:carbon-nitrogen hydrolase family protein [Opitutus sp. ER46]PTY00121.1 carbon-nitrogen hydrolase family protein [Opitutus sp. ER46]
MNRFRVALANARIPARPEESVSLAEQIVAEAGAAQAGLVCFPECYIPGYPYPNQPVAPADPAFLEAAWTRVGAAAARAQVGVILGTERVVDGDRRLTALVFDRDGSRLGFQDKVQLDPSEEPIYRPGAGRRVFKIGALTFGIVICHEGWRYPETVRAAARQGAQVVFHPHFDTDPAGPARPGFADPANTFHEKAMLCRAAENTCYFASVNCADAGTATTSAIARPDGTLLAFQPYGRAGLLVADLDLDLATGYLASRLRPNAN